MLNIRFFYWNKINFNIPNRKIFIYNENITFYSMTLKFTMVILLLRNNYYKENENGVKKCNNPEFFTSDRNGYRNKSCDFFLYLFFFNIAYSQWNRRTDFLCIYIGSQVAAS